MRRIISGLCLASVCLGLTLAGQSLAEGLAEGPAEGIQGRFELQGDSPVVVADRVYQITGTTRIVDTERQGVTLEGIHPGRDVLIESSTDIGGTANPVATGITVLEPH